ncbi:hypothetical protein GCM10009784_28810 [Arthrobacter parietis]|uniref:Multidrug ABC transporter ATPase n=2 Tax=Arthrobacter TaxID=1663 RepID=A0ABT6CX63_9MICC|nr:hypothetical protein [Arthrobacter vasquezii]MDF9278495.1 hypothetical protein [Arthrobacter vasquezii]
MSQNPSSVPAANDDGGRNTRRARLALLIAAVGFAVLGLLSLVAVLFSAWAGAEAWPGFVTAAYFFLPLGFLLMAASVVVSVLRRGRS